MNKKIVLSLIFFTVINNLCSGQSGDVISNSSLDAKLPYSYEIQKEITNNVTAKESIVPFKIPDPKSMVAINQSGDGIINVPLVTVKGRKLSLPLTLTYTTSGITVDQKASEVGLGWNLTIGSITRDYGAYEPDYTYTGSEFKMLYSNGTSGFDNKLLSTIYDPSGNYGWVTQFIPDNQNRSLVYDNATGKAPDEYIINVPGLKSNSFWNSDASIPAYGSVPNAPSFTFSEYVPWKIQYNTDTFAVSQEVSRINEFNFESASDNVNGFYIQSDVEPGFTGDNTSNLAAAIGLYPYVKNQSYTTFVLDGTGSSFAKTALPKDYLESYFTSNPPVSAQNKNLIVTYADYSKFTITTSDGTQYIFGKPLRGQKYLFGEEPYWSAMNTDRVINSAQVPPNMCYDELWKTDYIAEWLLTEIRSNDYVDANNDGIADDGDYGDWIRVDYIDTVRYEAPSGIATYLTIPQYREWMNFTQTDKESSLMRERAYVSKITTPIESVTFSNSEKFDVDFDYFENVFNRVSAYCTGCTNDYPYDVTNVHADYDQALGPWQNSINNWAPITQDPQIRVYYPLELKRYDSISVNENISSNQSLVQNVKLNYAQKGSTNELAVSHYLILDNNKNFTFYDPSLLGSTTTTTNSLDPSNFLKTTGRGKTTLIGVDYRGSSISSTNKISYSFGYNYNPSFDDIHKFEIYKQAVFPTTRESPRIAVDDIYRWDVPREIGTATSQTYIPNSILPWKTIRGSFDPTYSYGNENWSTMLDQQTVHTNPTIIQTGTDYQQNPIMEDEFGYFFTGTYPNYLSSPPTNMGRDAWTLTTIGLPYGGEIDLKYGLDNVDIDNDRANWVQGGILDYCIPSVGHYNNTAHLRNIVQSKINYTTNFSTGNYIHPYDEFYFLLNQNSGGLRINEIDFKDPYANTTTVKQYQYGTGHFTMPPAQYWQNYLQALGEFMYDEQAMHSLEGPEMGITVTSVSSEFQTTMMRLVSNTRIDNSIKQLGKHYYEYIDEVNTDNSKTRWYYGKLNNSGNLSPTLPYYSTKYSALKGGLNDRNGLVELLSTDMDHSQDIGNYKTEYYDNNANLVKQDFSTFQFSEITNNSISLGQRNLWYYPYVAYWADNLNSNLLERNDATANSVNFQGSVQSFYNNFYSSTKTLSNVISALNYGTSSTAPISPFPNSWVLSNGIGEAVNPLTKIGLQCSKYTWGIPAWWQGINNVLPPWQNVMTNSDMNAAFSNLFTNAANNANTINWLDDGYQINSLSFKTHQSYFLRPTHTQTITFY